MIANRHVEQKDQEVERKIAFLVMEEGSSLASDALLPWGNPPQRACSRLLLNSQIDQMLELFDDY
jgi:hypothetical protein